MLKLYNKYYILFKFATLRPTQEIGNLTSDEFKCKLVLKYSLGNVLIKNIAVNMHVCTS